MARATETNAPMIVVALMVMTALALLFMGLRFACKARYHKRFGWDDYFLAASGIILVVFSSLSIASTQYGIGQHITTISLDDRVIALKLLYIGRFFGIIALAVSKTSFGITLLHLALAKWQRIMIWFILVTLNLVLWLAALSLFVQCSPIDKAWDLNISGSCWSGNIQVDIGIAAGAYSAGMDFTLALFPTFLIWRLQMDKREKIGVIVAMSLGILAGITAGVKTSFISGSGRSVDFTFTTTPLLIWSGAETAVTIIATSIPFLRLLLKEVTLRMRTPQLQANSFDQTSAGRALAADSKPSRKMDDDDSNDSMFSVEKKGRLVFEGGKARVTYIEA